ncbi:MAG: diaminopimelate dehydrogenase [Defluviitaleaceae bacterium]|nr:diaminopimelate dehydrogenase [Defluviitaleaceae bacterium]
MGMIKVAIVGFGNIGRAAYDAVVAAPDMELVGVVDTAAVDMPHGVRLAGDVGELGVVDLALLCLPSRAVADVAVKLLAAGVNTVDSYDIHGDLYDVQQRLATAALAGGAVSVIGAGWDPGLDSVMRNLLEAASPKGITFTNFGPGMSMGHTVAVKAIAGVKKALSVTMPVGAGVHRRMVYVEVVDKNEFPAISEKIKGDPYFVKDETHVFLVEDVDSLKDMGHGVNMTRKGVSGATDNQIFTFEMRINNPALTAQLMAAAGRAAMRQQPGSYTMIELPPVDLLPGGREAAIRRLV